MNDKITTDTECGDVGKKDTPVPMPNTAVKLLSADGSWTFGPVRVGRCHANVVCYSVSKLENQTLFIQCLVFFVYSF